jgi:Domain of unknown function (DUF1707)
MWSRFEHDPRDPAYAGLRASDRDRSVVHDVLAESYAEGRLDRDELDERIAAVDAAKTYADLVPPLRDLTADATPAQFRPMPSGDLRRSAQVYYGSQLRDALFGFLVPNLICWMIWFPRTPDALGHAGRGVRRQYGPEGIRHGRSGQESQPSGRSFRGRPATTSR